MSEGFNIGIEKYLPLGDVVFNTIRDAIVSGTLQPGERLIEKQLADKIGVSRTPVREALRKLEIEGFIEMIPRKGAIVKVMVEKDITDVLQIRASLEGLAARLACENMTYNEMLNLDTIRLEFEDAKLVNDLDKMLKKDVELHDLIFESTKNERLVQFINNLREQIYMLRLTYLKDESYTTQIMEEHDNLVAAIKERDADRAEKVSIGHIKNQEEAVIKSLNKYD